MEKWRCREPAAGTLNLWMPFRDGDLEISLYMGGGFLRAAGLGLRWSVRRWFDHRIDPEFGVNIFHGRMVTSVVSAGGPTKTSARRGFPLKTAQSRNLFRPVTIMTFNFTLD